jgi:hypothetical protein
MDIAHHNRFTTKQMKAINRCRLWLQVNTLAEITNIEGTELLMSATIYQTDRNRSPDLWLISRSNLTWPTQEHPSSRDWRTWKKLLDCVASPNTATLKKPLGPWNRHWQTHRTWTYTINQKHNTITCAPADGARQYFKLQRRTTQVTQAFILTNTTPTDQSVHPITPKYI